MITHETFWPPFERVDLLSEVILTRCNPHGRRWKNRCNDWLTHITAQAALESGVGMPVPGAVSVARWGQTRIDIAFSHLDVLDTKFGFLLTVNTLLFSVPGLMAQVTSTALQGRWQLLAPRDVTLLWIAVGVFVALWFATTGICVSGLNRLVWGDFGLVYGVREPLESLLADPALLSTAEDQHVTQLLSAVVQRTAKFRLAMRCLVFNVWTTLFLVVFCSYLIHAYGTGA